jgi:hypothetical protein
VLRLRLEKDENTVVKQTAKGIDNAWNAELKKGLSRDKRKTPEEYRN